MKPLYLNLEGIDNGKIKNRVRSFHYEQPGFKFLTKDVVEHTIFKEDTKDNIERKVIFNVVGRHLNERKARDYKKLRDQINSIAVL
tara:strand:- start:243 stop:500 length:258 start_codon:yes stop_codon:yes gene_type:complete